MPRKARIDVPGALHHIIVRPLQNTNVVIASPPVRQRALADWRTKQTHKTLIIHPPAADFVASLLAMTKTAVMQRSQSYWNKSNNIPMDTPQRVSYNLFIQPNILEKFFVISQLLVN